MRINDTCRACLLDKKLNAYPASAARTQIDRYQRDVRRAIDESGASTAPEVVARISAIYREIFGPERDYRAEKRRFNALMLDMEPEMRAAVGSAADPLRRAVQYAMIGNFIDFAALGNVDEAKLRRLMDEAGDVSVDASAYEVFRREILSARRLVYFTDNCGEIVADKLLIRTMRELNRDLWVTVIVRGAPVLNDATLEDAEQVGMASVAQTVMGSGVDLPGVVLDLISRQARREVEAADLLVSKGQANYEGLSGCDRNIFYIFMCKCRLFMERFGVAQYGGVLTRETR